MALVNFPGMVYNAPETDTGIAFLRVQRFATRFGPVHTCGPSTKRHLRLYAALSAPLFVCHCLKLYQHSPLFFLFILHFYLIRQEGRL